MTVTLTATDVAAVLEVADDGVNLNDREHGIAAVIARRYRTQLEVSVREPTGTIVRVSLDKAL